MDTGSTKVKSVGKYAQNIPELINARLSLGVYLIYSDYEHHRRVRASSFSLRHTNWVGVAFAISRRNLCQHADKADICY